MHGIKERLRRIGAAVQRLPERAREKAIVIVILIVYGKDMCHEWLETRRERQGKKEQAERHDGGRGDRPARRRKRNKALRGRSH